LTPFPVMALLARAASRPRNPDGTRAGAGPPAGLAPDARPVPSGGRPIAGDLLPMCWASALLES
jgi:hypothetical protein